MAGLDRDKALDVALAQIDKQFGKGSVMRLGDEGRAPVRVIPTGSIALDVALGVGGLPRGRVVEIFGPESSGKTTVALHAVANAQAAGGIAAFIDAEHALDPEYAKALGVDIDGLLVSQPDTGEQALEIADMLIRSGALDIIVIDSVAALVPRAEIEGEMGDSHVGLQARLMSQALRKLAGALNNSGTTAIFINQLREKVGVMFGCGSYHTRVTLADGSQEMIGRIVSEKLPVEVLSYDPELGRVVPKKVVNWFDNGVAEEFLEFSVERGGVGADGGRAGHAGHASMAMTPNHLVRTPGGWREAQEIVVGDRVMLAQPKLLSPTQWQMVLGSVMGGGGFSDPADPAVPAVGGPRFRFGSDRGSDVGSDAAHPAHLDWTASMFGNIPHDLVTDAEGTTRLTLAALPELDELRAAVDLGDDRTHLSWDYLKTLTPLGLATWYLQAGRMTGHDQAADGSAQRRPRRGAGRIEVDVESLSVGSRDRLVAYLRDTHRLDATVVRSGVDRRSALRFTTAASLRFQRLVAPYVHEARADALLPRFQGRFAVEAEFAEPTPHLVPARVLEITSRRDYDNMNRFDLEIEGSHNYLADGICVHNSPETTSGGRALKFYASVRLDVRRIETLKDGGDAVANRTRVKVVKNKCLAAGTRVFDPVTGRTRRIEDIVDGRIPMHVVAADKKGMLDARPVVSWFDQGEQEVLGLRLRDNAEVWVTPDHRILTDRGWRTAAELRAGDRVARPRDYLGFGSARPVPAAHARMLGYLVAAGRAVDVSGASPARLDTLRGSVRQDAARVATELGAEVISRPGSVEITGGPDSTLAGLSEWAGIGPDAGTAVIPAAFFAADISAEIVANLLFGLFESHGWVSTGQRSGLHIGFATTTEQVAHQIHWLLLRWGIGSQVREAHGQWGVRVTGADNVRAFAAAIPTWGPHGQELLGELPMPGAHLCESQQIHLSEDATEPVLAHLTQRGVTPELAAGLIGDDAGDPAIGLAGLLGTPRLRRDRLSRLAEELDDAFLTEVLAEQVWYSTIREVLPVRHTRTFDLEVEEHHTLVAGDVVMHNCAPPFKQAEFDIVYGQGISREGSLIDVGVEQSIVRKSGAWYTYEGDQLGQGKENVRNFLRDNPDLANEIEKKIKEKLGVGPTLDEEPAAPAPAPTAAPVTKAASTGKAAGAGSGKAAKGKAAPAPVDF